MKNHKDILRSLSGGHVLDVATGRGRSLISLMENLKSFSKITAIDTIDYTTESEDDILKHEKVNYV
jgi:ubiquinone/menaquinone biosynthesis C-methylase UbiE